MMNIETTFFRPIAVHLQDRGTEATFFRSIPVQLEPGFDSFPADTRSLPGTTGEVPFPEHSRSLPGTTGEVLFPEHSRSLPTRNLPPPALFRPISVHSCVVFHYLCTGCYSLYTSTTMAGTVKEMSLIKQMLQLRQLGESNRGIARKFFPLVRHFAESQSTRRP